MKKFLLLITLFSFSKLLFAEGFHHHMEPVDEEQLWEEVRREASKKETKWYRNKTKKELIEITLKAAPKFVTRDATIMIPDKHENLITIREGTNGFICQPKADFSTPMWDPACSDLPGHQWLTSLQNADPEPANTVPGVIYMFEGGQHWGLKDGTVVPPNTPGSILMRNPAHWMILWPFATETLLPGYPNTGDVTLILGGTPYAALVFPKHTLCFSKARFVTCEGDLMTAEYDQNL